MIGHSDDVNKTNIENIEKAKETRTYIKNELEQKQRILNYTDNEIINNVNNLYYKLSSDLLYKAWKYIHREEKEENKSAYDYVKCYVSGAFFKNKGKLLDILACNNYNDVYAYSIYYEYSGIKFLIKYPCPKYILSDNFVETDYGKIVLNYESKPSVYDYIGSSYEPEEITIMIENSIEKPV